MGNGWCRRITNCSHLMIVNDKFESRACCWTTPSAEVVNDIDEFILRKKLAAENITQNISDECRECILREQHGYQTSSRQKINSQIPEDIPDYEFKELRIQIDNVCNAACITCGPMFSSLWETLDNCTGSTYDVDKAYELLLKTHDLSKVTRIVFLGGEPFLSKHNIDLINRVPNPKNVALRFVTNGSIIPNDLTKWANFNRIVIVISIDGIEDQFEYIRWPLKWNVVTKNINKLIELKNTIMPNLVIAFNYTVSPLNVWYFDKVERWHSTLPTSETMPLRIGNCTSDIWGLDGIPNAIRNAVYEKYDDGHRIVKQLQSIPGCGNERFSVLLNEAEKLDTMRKNSVYHTFSEILRIAGFTK